MMRKREEKSGGEGGRGGGEMRRQRKDCCYRTPVRLEQKSDNSREREFGSKTRQTPKSREWQKSHPIDKRSRLVKMRAEKEDGGGEGFRVRRLGIMNQKKNGAKNEEAGEGGMFFFLQSRKAHICQNRKSFIELTGR